MNRVGSIGDVYNYVGGYKWVSFDLFDTLLYRHLLKVNEVHDTVSAYVLTQVGKRRTGSPFDLTLLRYRMTNVLKVAGDGANQEPRIDAVWDHLLRHDVPDPAERAVIVERVVSFELELELCNLRLVPGVADLLARLRLEGRTIVAISDMYFDHAQMETILRKLGIIEFIDHLYVSAEVQRTKQTGDLFRHVLHDLQIVPAQFVHIGDNLKSDVERAIEVGLTAVLVDQQHLLEVERPAYGGRMRIEADVADLVKVHLFSLLLEAQDRQLDRLYFMARDGCVVADFLNGWTSPLIGRFLPAPQVSILYLNRVLSCWGGIDFAGEWLLQAVDLVLWLHHETATPEELCAMLGLDEVPHALGHEVLRGGPDTRRIAAILSEANLEARIKDILVARRAEIVQYLEGVGFFNDSAVAFSDIGYTGTVLRDLNNLFLNRAPQEDALHPPAMLLSLLATNDNITVNRPRAYPFVEFAPHAVLPADKLPDELKASFAWLEFFFKHPTLMPILKFIEIDGRVEPELNHRPAVEEAVPSQRLLSHAVQQDADIVLLWMAAVNQTGSLVDPIIDRFANPDADTIGQMQDEIYEKHSVLGTRRSIFLTLPGARVETISLTAQQGDYWIPGSIVASGAAGHIGVEEDKSAPPRRGLRHLFRWRRRQQPSLASELPDSFDPTFYRDFYADLRQFTTVEALWKHYVQHGRAENRLATPQALIAQLELEFQSVPADFDGRAYLRLNADLSSQIDNPLQALDHYMRYGRHEGRKYLGYDLDLPATFERLRTEGSIILDRDEAALWAKGEDTLSLFLRRHRVIRGEWLNDLDVAEFRALHSAWCGPVDSAAACIVVLLERGMAKCPSLSLRAPFDADYYRSQRPEFQLLVDEDLFRHYLNHASRDGLYSSEASALRDVWGSPEFPACLDWEGYKVRRPALEGATRSAVLAAFIDDPDQARLDFVDRENGASLIEYLGLRAWRRHGRSEEGRSLLELALGAGGSVGHIQHVLGDMALQLGQPDRALTHFRLGTAAPDADLWSFTNAARLLLDRGDYRSALIVLANGAVGWQERAPWRRLWDAAMHARCDATLRNFVMRSDRASALAEVDALMDDIAERVPAELSLNDAPGILIITSHPIDTITREMAARSNITLANLPGGNGDDLTDALLACRVVIFHEMVFAHDVLHTIALARSLGKRSVAWLGDLAVWEGHPLQHLLATDTARGSAVRLGDLYALALVARYCDSTVTTLAGCVPLLAQIAPDREIEVTGVESRNCRDSAQARRVVLVAPDPGLEPSLMDQVAQAVGKAAQKDTRLFFLAAASLAQRPAFRAITGRWAVIDDDPDIVELAQLTGTVDAVLHSQATIDYAYSMGAEAAARGVAAYAFPIPTPAGKGRAKVKRPMVDVDDLANSILRMVEEPRPASSLPLPHCTSQDRPAADASTARPVKRILFANVFFAPQVIGGATRVLKDNIDYLLDQHCDEFEIAVFTADEQNEHVYESRIDTYRGIPVFRVSTPQELNMDWRGDNVVVGTKFAAVLAAYKPDLVHIHCLQRLSVTVAEACRASGVPYIVTLHDAWWISDFPFLTNELGMPALAHPDYYNQQQLGGGGISLSIRRAERLRTALLGAERRLAVSESFAEIYRAVGIPCETVENGVSRIEPVPRAAPGSRVELCHIGGLQYHKGAYLVEAALRNNAYANLHYTVVDLARGTNQETRSVWGTTPVTITGKMSTGDLARFYARMNVLLAPSTWPESYGLVSREALGHGLWVVASKEGGSMAESVVPSLNGFVISVETADDLAEVLRVIDHDAPTYRLPPKTTGKMRSADDQSRDLVALYRSVVPNRGENMAGAPSAGQVGATT